MPSEVRDAGSDDADIPAVDAGVRPKLPTAELRQIEAILRDVCPVEYATSEVGIRVGCADCGAFEGASEHYEIVQGEPPRWQASGLMRGRWLRASSEQALIRFAGTCGRRSVAVLFVRVAGTWAAVDEPQPTDLGRCISLPANGGRNLLVCTASYSHMTSWRTGVRVIDFEGGAKRERALLELEAWQRASHVPRGRVSEVEVMRLEGRDVDADGWDDLLVHVIESQYDGTALARLRAEERKPPVLRSEGHALEFRQTGEGLVATQATKRLLGALRPRLVIDPM